MNNTYRFTVGAFQCLAINDGTVTGNADLLFANAPQDKLQRVHRQYGLNPAVLPSTWTCLLIETPTNRVLIDTGLGAGGEHGGQLLPGLQSAGVGPEDIDTVVLTHAHADHIGGCVDSDGNLVFPQATFYMSHAEWQFWTSDATLAQAPDWAAAVARQKLPPLAARLTTIDSEADIVPGIRAIPAPGHTPGHIAVEITSRGSSLLNLADVALHPLHIEFPEWVARVDMAPEQTVRTRQTLFQRAADRETAVLAFHFHPFPSLGHIVKQTAGWQWRPVPE